MFTLGGLSIGEQVKEPKVVGAVNDESLIKKYAKYGIDFDSGGKVGTIVGASGLLIGLGKYYGIKGVCLLGETSGFPIIPDHRSAEVVLKVLIKILNVKIDTSRIEKKVKEMEEFMRKIESVEARAISQLLKTQKPKEEKLTYIG